VKTGLFFAICLFIAIPSFAAEDTNVLQPLNTNDVANALVQLQAQLHSARLQIELSREEAADTAQSNMFRIQLLEQNLTEQRRSDAHAQQLTLYLVGTVGLAGLAVVLLAGYFQWRSFSQLAQMTAHHGAALAAMNGVHQLAAPGRAAVDVSSARLLDIVGQLEKKILDMESGGRLLPGPATASADPLAEGQKLRDANEPQAALEQFERFLAAQPGHAEGLAKKASALEKLGRQDESLVFCDKAIAANSSLVIAYLQKGGLLNRAGRYEEALKCYEQAMAVQDQKTVNR